MMKLSCEMITGQFFVYSLQEKSWQANICSISYKMTVYLSCNWIYFHRFYRENGCKPDNACGTLRESTAASELPWTVGSRKSVNDSFDFEFQSRLHECEATTARDKSILLREVGTHLCAGFFCCPKAGYNWMTGWIGYDRAMISLWWERAQQRCGETPGQGQKNDIQADRRK